jgi:flagellar protein FlaG
MNSINVNTLPVARSVSTDTVSEGAKPSKEANVEVAKKTQSVEQVNSRMLDQRSRSSEQIRGLQERLEEAIRTLNDKMAASPKDLRFSVDEISKRLLVVVTNEDTGEVIRQVPAEAVLRVAHNIEALKGVLFDKVL